MGYCEKSRNEVKHFHNSRSPNSTPTVPKCDMFLDSLTKYNLITRQEEFHYLKVITTHSPVQACRTMPSSLFTSVPRETSLVTFWISPDLQADNKWDAVDMVRCVGTGDRLSLRWGYNLVNILQSKAQAEHCSIQACSFSVVSYEPFLQDVQIYYKL